MLREAPFNGETLGKVWINGKVGQLRLWAINKTEPGETLRNALTDKRLAYVYLNERWTPGPMTAAERERMAEAQAEFRDE